MSDVETAIDGFTRYGDNSSDSEFDDSFDMRLDVEFNAAIKKKMKAKDEGLTREETRRFSKSPTFLTWVTRPESVDATAASPPHQNFIGKASTEVTASSVTSSENKVQSKRISKSPTFLRWDVLDGDALAKK